MIAIEAHGLTRYLFREGVARDLYRLFVSQRNYAIDAHSATRLKNAAKRIAVP